MKAMARVSQEFGRALPRVRFPGGPPGAAWRAAALAGGCREEGN